MQIFNLFEQIFMDYQHTVQALVAIGTILSVIVAVVLAISQNKLKARGTISVKIFLTKFGFVEPGVRIDEQVITEADGELYTIANIQNIGNIRLAIDNQSFYVKIPFYSTLFIMLPYTIERGHHKFPHWIEPRESKAFLAPQVSPPISPIKNCLYRLLLQVFSTRLLRWTRLLQIKAFTFTSTGQVIRLKISEYKNKQWLDIILQKTVS